MNTMHFIHPCRAGQSVCAALLAAMTSLAMAQSCPPNVQVRSEPQQVAQGWEGKPKVAVHNLVGVSILDGPLTAGEGYDQAPQQMPDGAQLWKFRGPLGENEVWMRCWFADTDVQVQRRLDARVTECEQRITRDPKTRKILKATAVCR